ncbi:MAG: O-antigen ligase family protein [bacterium]
MDAARVSPVPSSRGGARRRGSQLGASLETAGRASGWILGVTLAIAPFLLGGVPTRARLALGIAVLLAALVALGAGTARARSRRGSRAGEPGVAWHRALLVVSLAWVAWVAATLVPLPLTALARVSPGKARILSQALGDASAAVSAAHLAHPLSLSPGDTADALVWLIAVLAVVQLVAATGTLGERGIGARGVRPATRALACVALVGTLVSLLALLQQATWNGRILWLVRPVEWGMAIPDGSRASGPFVNPDQFASFAFLAGVAAVTLIAQAWFSSHVLSPRARDGLGALGVAGTMVTTLGVIASGSRTAFALMALFGVVTATRMRSWLSARGEKPGGAGRGRRESVAPLVLVVLVVAALGVSLLSENVRAVVVRWLAVLTPGAQRGSWAARVAVWRQSIAMIDALPLGVGLGAWAVLHPLFVAPPVHALVWHHAHSDALEAIAEAGIPGAVLLIGGVATVVRAIVVPAREAAPHELSVRARTVLLTGLAGFAVHACVDSPLRAPATALALGVLVGAGARRRCDERARESAADSADLVATPDRRWTARLESVAGGAGALAVAWSLCVSVADFEPRLARWRVAPRSAERELGEGRALLAAVGGAGQLGAHDREEAAERFRRAIRLSPLRAAAHHGLAITSSDPEEAARALERAAAFAPWSSLYQDQLAMLELARGNEDAALGHVTRALRSSPSLEAHAYLAANGARGLGSRLVDAVESGLSRAMSEGGDPELAGDALARLLESRGEHAREGEVLAMLAARDGAPRRWSLAAVRAFRRSGELGRADAEERRLLERAGAADVATQIELACEVDAPLGDFERAERRLARAADRAGRDARIALARGRIASLRGDVHAASEAFRTAAEWAPSSADAQLALAEALRSQQRYGEALTAFERAIDLGSGTPAVWARVAEVREKRREYRQAAAAYREVLRRRPGDGWVVAALERTERLARGEATDGAS